MQSQQTNENSEGDGDKTQDYISRSEFKECMRELSEKITQNICNEIKMQDSTPPCRTPETSLFEAEMKAIERQELRAQQHSMMSSMDARAEGNSGAMSYDRHWKEAEPNDYMRAMPREASRHMGTRPKEFDHKMMHGQYKIENEHTDAARHTGYRNQGPSIKLPSYDGKIDIEVFLAPFERLAARYGWNNDDKIDRVFQCLQGTAMRYLCGLPQDVVSSYVLIKQHLTHRFGIRDPPSTIRRKLGEMRQGANETNEEFAEEINKLVTRAFPDVTMDMIDELSAEYFLRGYKNTKLTYEALNKNPRTLNHALNDITLMEHNYRATLGRDNDRKERTTRRVNWSDMVDTKHEYDYAGTVNRVGYENKPTYVTVNQLDARLKRIEEMLLRTHVDQRYQSRSRSPSPGFGRQCFHCGEQGHMVRDCQKAQNDPTTPTSPMKEDVTCYQCGGQGHISRECPSHSRSPSPRRPAQQPDKSIKVSHLDCTGWGIMIPLRINGIETCAVVDTGADATIISTCVAKEANIAFNDASKKCKLLSAADNEEMPAFGGVTATLQIAGKEWNWPVYVAPIRDKVLLGMDFLRESDAKIFAKQGDLVFGDQLVIGRANTGETPVSLLAKTDEVIYPASGKIIVGRAAGPSNTDNSTMVLDARGMKNGLQVGSVLVTAKKSVLIRILNLDNKPYHVKDVPNWVSRMIRNQVQDRGKTQSKDGNQTGRRGNGTSDDTISTGGAGSLRTAPQLTKPGDQTVCDGNRTPMRKCELTMTAGASSLRTAPPVYPQAIPDAAWMKSETRQ